jgi:hypothetical protein
LGRLIDNTGRRLRGAPARAAILCRVEWFFTALLVIIALAAAGVAGLAAYRIYTRLS